MERTYDICIVGAGMWGSAAARHVSAHPGLKVCLLGPKEPPPEDYQSSHVLASHYDSGRIYRETDSDPIWATLGERSIAGYSKLEELTGIKLHRNVGSIITGLKDEAVIPAFIESSKRLPHPFKVCSSEELTKLFPYLQVGPEYTSVITMHNTGYIDPRKMVLAQRTVAHFQGCDWIDDTALSLKTMSHTEKTKHVKIQTAKNETVFANKVLLCTGAFTNFYELLPDGLNLDLVINSRMVVLAEAAGPQLAKLKNMPVMIYFAGEKNNATSFYLLPPIEYPNGKYYVKIGHRKNFQQQFESLDEIKSYFISRGDPKIGDFLTQLLHKHVDFESTSIEYVSAVTCKTKHNHPYCGMVSPNIGVLVGGCSAGAKSCDEIGRMGANMIVKGGWDYDLPEDEFRPIMKNTSSKM